MIFLCYKHSLGGFYEIYNWIRQYSCVYSLLSKMAQCSFGIISWFVWMVICFLLWLFLLGQLSSLLCDLQKLSVHKNNDPTHFTGSLFCFLIKNFLCHRKSTPSFWPTRIKSQMCDQCANFFFCHAIFFGDF